VSGWCCYRVGCRPISPPRNTRPTSRGWRPTGRQPPRQARRGTVRRCCPGCCGAVAVTAGTACRCANHTPSGPDPAHSYVCACEQVNYGTGGTCQHIAGPALDAHVTGQVLEAVASAALDVSMAAATQAEDERTMPDKLWRQRNPAQPAQSAHPPAARPARRARRPRSRPMAGPRPGRRPGHGHRHHLQLDLAPGANTVRHWPHLESIMGPLWQPSGLPAPHRSRGRACRRGPQAARQYQSRLVPARRFIALVQSGKPGMPAYVPDYPWCGRGGACEDAGLFVLCSPIPADVTVWTAAPPGELRLLRQTKRRPRIIFSNCRLYTSADFVNVRVAPVPGDSAAHARKRVPGDAMTAFPKPASAPSHPQARGGERSA
jgi:hypothetical protein